MTLSGSVSDVESTANKAGSRESWVIFQSDKKVGSNVERTRTSYRRGGRRGDFDRGTLCTLHFVLDTEVRCINNNMFFCVQFGSLRSVRNDEGLENVTP
jgi:hypothetical protein